jgi:hypothetical protein
MILNVLLHTYFYHIFERGMVSLAAALYVRWVHVLVKERMAYKIKTNEIGMGFG